MAKMGTICPPIRAMPSDLNTHPAMIDRAIETFAPIHRMGRWCVLFACNMDQCFRISIGGSLDDDVLIAFLIDWLLAMFAKDHFRHFSIVL